MDGGGPSGMKNGPQREETAKCVLGRRSGTLKEHYTKQRSSISKCVRNKYTNHEITGNERWSTALTPAQKHPTDQISAINCALVVFLHVWHSVMELCLVFGYLTIRQTPNPELTAERESFSGSGGQTLQTFLMTHISLWKKEKKEKLVSVSLNYIITDAEVLAHSTC